MAEYIDRDIAVSIITEQQKSICPTGLWSRNAVYGTDRERFDAWQEIIDQIEAIPAAAVAPVVHGRWVSWAEAGNFIPSSDRYECSVCHDAAHRLCNGDDLLSPFCPNCGAKMQGEVNE